MPVRLDGETVRGAKDTDGNQRHLLAALAGRTAAVLGGRSPGRGRGQDERSADGQGRARPDRPERHGCIRANALHTVKATAEFIRERGGEFILPVKENRKALFDALDALPWHQVPVAHSATDRGHGRITTRTIQVLPAPQDLPFPHVSQVLLMEGYVSDLAGNPRLGGGRVRRRPARSRTGPVPPTWPAMCASNGRSSLCTGCVTLCIRKINRGSEPGPGRG